MNRGVLWGALGLTAVVLWACDDSASPADSGPWADGGGGAPDKATARDGPRAPDARRQDQALRADGASPLDRGPDGATAPCPRALAPADRLRRVVVAHPIAGPGKKSSLFEVLELSAAGKLSRVGRTFHLGAGASAGEIAFTPDGEVGLVAIEGGALGVFKLDSGGNVQVLHQSFKGGWWANSVVMAPTGDRAYVLSAQWRNVGGGIYSVKIGCDGTLTDEGMVTASKLPYAMRFPDPAQPTRAALVAQDVLASKVGDDVHLLTLGPSPTLLAGVDAYGDDKAIVSWAALTQDRRYLLAADNSLLTSNHRVAVVELTAGGTLRAAQVLTGFKDPAAIVTSPFHNAALVSEAQGNVLTLLGYDPTNSATPFTDKGTVPTNSKPQLPADMVQISRGTLQGRVLVAENVAIRQVQFTAAGGVTEVELLSLGNDSLAIPGAIGVQP